MAQEIRTDLRDDESKGHDLKSAGVVYLFGEKKVVGFDSPHRLANGSVATTG